ncbi:MAG: aspartyl/asparaginyl beta-hydroxylase domain-containing protein [Myxococcales bacterium]|nr:aspartyl/asparaginyl beta-hydroxylase domain-containing protein [Myxococcales bacterium]MCB9755752.1 aspartyl/asparaginyl beta-hydroxylase domain-containing protein [Myxococcales bacterium]
MPETRVNLRRLLSMLPDAARRRAREDAPEPEPERFLFQSELGRSGRPSELRQLLRRVVPMLPDPVLKRLSRGGSKGLSADDIDAVLRYQRGLEELPTVRRGMRALGMRSLLEWPLDRDGIMRRRSPYTHPMMRPLFFTPGLAARMRHDPAEFSWVPRLEAAYPTIKQELLAALERNEGFQPFVPAKDQGEERWLVQSERGVVYSDDTRAPSMWNVMYLYMGGPIQENRARCPETVKLLESIPRFARHAPAVFSALHPGTHIAPHHGPRNSLLRVHLPLIAPGRCFLNVGSELFEWRDGKVELFNDAFVHQAWNQSDRTRVVLHFDIYHPDWTDEEVTRLGELDRELDSTAVMTSFHDVRERTKDLLDGRDWMVR